MKALFPYVAETRGVIVRVAVSFLPEQSEPERGRWFWAYHIRLENAGPQAVQLLTRHWVITDGRGARHSVEGEGVIGEQPLLAPGESFDYVSGCPLSTSTGSMLGSYHMMGEDGSGFDVEIPKFALIAPAVGA
ncbi:Co2+/Mg2+ efflux protein ApaG [Sphingomonas sp. TF3]|uniref:Co2+/Mg2+ efflux protein ApaG n=1 Tax=Sphingomonas sp. TF3 TaxID=2495580 RepID=UPI000F88C5A3|nr:Co2+/Mg2+ efflux protein ApaG [Sphingomonas sp. TF3]RUN76835.1 Co2+/Mg2+ efflux protein ApaG [Sphingomonas sp. TF3]